MKKLSFITLSLCSVLVFASCSKENVQPTPTPTPTPTYANNPTAYITDQQKQQMVLSIKDLHEGKMYELDYTCDYKLDDCLNTDVVDDTILMGFFFTKLFDKLPSSALSLTPKFGCSMYTATSTETGNTIMGRNLDYCHEKDGEILYPAAILMRTAPKGGKRSICMVDGAFLGIYKGFLNDGKTDLSMLMAAPYLFLDGINEDGLAVGVLYLDGNPAFQDEPGKNHIWGTTLMRLALDKAETVAEAEQLIRNYNISNVSQDSECNYHFMMADATGDYAIIECSYAPEQTVFTDYPNTLHFFGDDDCYRYVTNFYVDPRMANEPFGGLSDHGRDRYDTLRNTLQVKSYHLTNAEAKGLLSAVSQELDPSEMTSFTQWSSLYDLKERSLELALLREYTTWYKFSVE